jgi:hypothetical protein
MLSMAVVPEPMEHIMIISSNQKSNDTKASITVCSSPLCGVFLEYSAPAKATSTVYYWDYHNLVKSLKQLLIYLSKETQRRDSVVRRKCLTKLSSGPSIGFSKLGFMQIVHCNLCQI